MSYEFYKVLHVFGILLLFSSLGGVAVFAAVGSPDAHPGVRKALSIFHGVALLLILAAGFGLMARRGISHSGWPLWIYLKLGIWVLLGASLAFTRRMPGLARLWIILLPLLGSVAAYLAVTQPK